MSASVGAILSSLASLSCCLPLGFAAALGAQQRRATQCPVKGRVLGQVLLWAAVVVVLGMILFPQQIAGFLADRFSETGK